MRYLTLWALKMDKSSLKSWNIGGRALHRVGGKGDFSNRVHALLRGPAMPVPIFVGLHFIEAVIDADGLVHAFVYTTRRAALQCARWPRLLLSGYRLWNNTGHYEFRARRNQHPAPSPAGRGDLSPGPGFPRSSVG